ncbi:MAG: aldo/keto reductase [Patescibacteria group bacterium]
MTIPTKKLKSGFQIPVLGLGTWKMGGAKERDYQYQNEDKDIAAIREAYKSGITRFDTAESYAEGYSEEILGKGLKIFPREKLFVTSKVSAWNLQYDNILKSLENSLTRLQTDYLDLYLLHGPSLEVPIIESLKALDRVKSEGLVRNIGVCNFNVERFQQAQENTNNKLVLNQVHYNLIFREPVLKGVLDYCQNNDVLLEAWRPIQQGNLAKSGYIILDKLCNKYHKTPAQVAVNWLISQKNVVTLFKTSDPRHLVEIMGSLGWQLELEDIEDLKDNFPCQLDRSNAVQLI